jgi:uncharacterized protein YutE (UPF0331/DUF86 family)
MKRVDPVRIRELMRELTTRRSYLDQLRQLPPAEFVADFRNTESARHALLIAAQASIDICNHIAARSALRAPSDYADCFTVLSEQGVITGDLAERLKAMARFRNRLAHLYWEIDEKELYAILRNNLGDLDEFVEQIARWMQTGGVN